jgi:hypothetical protein
VVCSVCVFAVPAAALAWLLFDPGTTVRPVAPGVRGFDAAAELLPADPSERTSPVFIPDPTLLSAVRGAAVTDRLLP